MVSDLETFGLPDRYDVNPGSPFPVDAADTLAPIGKNPSCGPQGTPIFQLLHCVEAGRLQVGMVDGIGNKRLYRLVVPKIRIITLVARTQAAL